MDIHGINYLSTGAGFLPSTVFPGVPHKNFINTLPKLNMLHMKISAHGLSGDLKTDLGNRIFF